MKKLSITFLVLSLSACGGGGSDSAEEKLITQPVEVMPIGLWEGQTVIGNESIAVAALIAPNGEIRLISDDGEQDKGVLVLDGSTFSGDFKVYDEDGLYVESGTVSGDYTSTSITGTSFVNNVKVTTFSLSISDQSANGASLSTIKGNYATDDAQTSIAVDADGLITGSDTDGCQYSGALTVPDSSVNVYDMVLRVGSCGLFDGEYNGLATYAKPFTDSPVIGLVFQVDNGSFSVTDLLIK